MRMSAPLLLFCAAAAALDLLSAQAAEVDPIDIPGASLRDNPLGDPPARRAALLSPIGTKAGAVLPLVIYLPGWGGASSEDVLRDGGGGWIGQVVDRLTKEGTPVRIAVVDARSRYGGSQYVNSTATGRYGDYITEVLTTIEHKIGSGKPVLIAGHSSGGYGALLLGMESARPFEAVVALSPDSDFEVTHRPLVTQDSVRRLSPEDLQAAMAANGRFRLPADGLAALVVGLCANYAPSSHQRGKFEWLYDERGEWRPEAWKRWLEADPLTLVKSRAAPFAATQRIYLDGAEHDEFGANIGARKIAGVLKSKSVPVFFYESPGGHSDHMTMRLVKGLQWALAH